MHMTQKQKAVMSVVCSGNKDADGNLESWIDVDDVMQKCNLKCTKQAMQYTVRYLVQKGLVTKNYECRRGAKRVVLVPTALAFQVMSSLPTEDQDPAN